YGLTSKGRPSSSLTWRWQKSSPSPSTRTFSSAFRPSTSSTIRCRSSARAAMSISTWIACRVPPKRRDATWRLKQQRHYQWQCAVQSSQPESLHGTLSEIQLLKCTRLPTGGLRASCFFVCRKCRQNAVKECKFAAKPQLKPLKQHVFLWPLRLPDVPCDSLLE